MPLDRAVLNWHEERQIVRDFVKGSGHILHVIGTEGCHLNHFRQVVLSAVQAEFGREAKAASIDVLNMATASPLAALTSVIRDFGISLSVSGVASQTLTAPLVVASNIRARGSVTLESISVTHGSRNEGEELREITEALVHELESGLDLSGHLLVLVQCHEMKMRARRLFMSSLWEPVFERMLSCGMKAVFMFSPERLEITTGAIPPPATQTVLLPTRLVEDAVIEELARLAEDRSWAPPGEPAVAMAKTVMWTSQTVSDLYTRLAMISVKAEGSV